jgi:hypothetical protein
MQQLWLDWMKQGWLRKFSKLTQKVEETLESPDSESWKNIENNVWELKMKT